MRVVVNEAFLRRMIELETENAALKKQVNDMKVQGVAKEVARHVEVWIDVSAEKSDSDINDLALKITKYVDHRMRD